MRSAKKKALLVVVLFVAVTPVCWAGRDDVLSGRELLRARRERDTRSESAHGTSRHTQGTASTATEQARVRILHFPRDRSLGTLEVFTGTPKDSEITPLSLGRRDDHLRDDLGQAKGDVAVPADKPIHLIISSPSQDLSPLARLRPSDLYMLTINGAGQTVHNPDETVMPYLSGLTGLEFLYILDLNITRKGLKYISGLKSLKSLAFADKSRIGNVALALIATERPSLEGLAVSSDAITDKGLLHLAKMGSLEELFLHTPRVRGPGLAHLAQLPSVKYLELSGESFGDAHMKYLQNVISLRKLTLRWVSVTDAGMVYLSNLTNLEELRFRRFGWQPITEKGLAPLSKLSRLKRLEGIRIDSIIKLKCLTEMTELEKLDLDIEAVEDKDEMVTLLSKFKSLKDLKLELGSDKVLALTTQFEGLRHLDLRGDGITDAGLEEHLAKLTSLSKLHLESNTITTAGLSHLQKLKSLEVLHLSGDHITDAGMPHVAKITNLWQLHLDCPLTDDGLSHLSHMSQLRELSIKGRFTNRGLSYLQRLKELTHLRITSEHKCSPEALRRLENSLPKIRRFDVRNE